MWGLGAWTAEPRVSDGGTLRPVDIGARRHFGQAFLVLDDISDTAYTREVMGKPLIFLADEIRTPPMSATVRRRAGYLLRTLQLGRGFLAPLAMKPVGGA